MRRTPLDVLFLGTDEVGAQLAAAVLRHLSQRRARVTFASNARAARLEAQVLRAGARLLGVRLGVARVRRLEEIQGRPFHIVISVGEPPSQSPWPFITRFSGLDLDAEATQVTDAARQIVIQTDEWWKHHGSGLLASKRSPSRVRRPYARAQWRTTPGPDAPILLVDYLKSSRRCVGVCAFLERCGFHVVCGNKYGRNPESLGFIPDAIVLRVDGGRTAPGLRKEFATLPDLRGRVPATPVIAMLEGSLSAEEARMFEALKITPLRQGGYAELVRTLRQSVLQLLLTVGVPAAEWLRPYN